MPPSLSFSVGVPLTTTASLSCNSIDRAAEAYRSAARRRGADAAYRRRRGIDDDAEVDACRGRKIGSGGAAGHLDRAAVEARARDLEGRAVTCSARARTVYLKVSMAVFEPLK